MLCSLLTFKRIELLKYDKMTTLADIEEKKDVMNAKLDNLVTFLYTNPNTTEKNKKIIMKIRVADIINTENSIQELISNYQQINVD